MHQNSLKSLVPHHPPDKNLGPTLTLLLCASGFEMHQLYMKMFAQFISGILPLNNWPISFHQQTLLILIKCNFRARKHEPFPFLTNSSLVQYSIGEVILLELQLLEKLHILS